MTVVFVLILLSFIAGCLVKNKRFSEAAMFITFALWRMDIVEDFSEKVSDNEYISGVIYVIGIVMLSVLWAMVVPFAAAALLGVTIREKFKKD